MHCNVKIRTNVETNLWMDRSKVGQLLKVEIDNSQCGSSCKVLMYILWFDLTSEILEITFLISDN